MDLNGPSGVLLIDKAPDMTSHDVVAIARRALNTKKIGHCGTLDPMATGLLMQESDWRVIEATAARSRVGRVSIDAAASGR